MRKGIRIVCIEKITELVTTGVKELLREEVSVGRQQLFKQNCKLFPIPTSSTP
jgi:hypothetical protein